MINSYEPCTEAEWAEKYPQTDEQAGLDRLDLLAEFRVARVLSQHGRKSGAKNTKLFGRKFLQATRCWDELRPRAAGELAALDEPTVTAFLEGWAGAASGSDPEMAALVWATDFSAAVQARRSARAQDVRARAERMAANEGSADELRAMLGAAHLGSAGRDEGSEDEEGSEGP